MADRHKEIGVIWHQWNGITLIFRCRALQKLDVDRDGVVSYDDFMHSCLAVRLLSTLCRSCHQSVNQLTNQMRCVWYCHCQNDLCDSPINGRDIRTLVAWNLLHRTTTSWRHWRRLAQLFDFCRTSQSVVNANAHAATHACHSVIYRQTLNLAATCLRKCTAYFFIMWWLLFVCVLHCTHLSEILLRHDI